MQDVLFNEDQIRDKIISLATQIEGEYGNSEIIIIGVLVGSCIFTSDLIRALWNLGMTNPMVDFIGISSYGENRESSKTPRITKDTDINILGKDVLIIEDIAESGLSLRIISDSLKKRGAKSVKSVVLLDKPGKRVAEYVPDFIGFTVPDDVWIEGFGLDTAYKGRGNPRIVAR